MDDNTRLRLSGIRVYPLKGAGGFDLQETGLDSFGIPGDRRWMLARPDGQFISQRTHPRLSLVRTALPEASGDSALRFAVSAPGQGAFELVADRSHDWLDVRVHDDRFRASVGNQEADEWFSAFLGEACRLVFLPDEVLRPVDPAYAPGHRVGLADGYPLHLTTEESLSDLNRVLPTRTNMLRYRPNLVVSGGRPWEEDEWRVLKMGGVEFHLVKPCARCTVVTIDQGSGTRGREPLHTLKSFRKWEGKVFFGQNAVFSGTGRFRVGENVHILERGSPRPPLGSGAEN